MVAPLGDAGDQDVGDSTGRSRTSATSRQPPHEDQALPWLMLAGLLALAVGLGLFVGPYLDADTPARTLAAIASQLPVTLPAAIAVTAATGVVLAAGMSVARWLGHAPFTSLGEAVGAGLAGAVAITVVCLLVLGPLGLFTQLPLLIVCVVLILAGLRHWPWHAPGFTVPPHIGLLGALLVATVWVGPSLLQLASPVPPFIDVLANHVAPVAHLRAYGTWEELAVSPAPTYGPTRIFLGYVSLLGAITSLTGLSAELAVSAFTTPLVLLIALTARHLVRTLSEAPSQLPSPVVALARRTSGGDAAWWVLLTLPLTFVFLRLPDARASTLVFALVAFALAFVVAPGTQASRASGALLALAAGCSFLVHPMGGLLALATVLLVGLLLPSRTRLVIAGAVGAGIVAMPQAATMLALTIPPPLAVMAIPLGVGTAALLASGSERGRDPRALRVTPRRPGWPWLVLGVTGVLFATALVVSAGGRDPLHVVTGAAAAVILDWWVLLLPGVLAILTVRAPGARAVILAGLLVGAATALGVALLERSLPASQFVRSLDYEGTKEIVYWTSWWLAIGGALGLAAWWQAPHVSSLARVAPAAVFVVAAAIAPRADLLEIAGYEQHRYAETLAIAVRHAERGYWAWAPDPRTILDDDRRGLIAAVRREQETGRMTASTSVLHLAAGHDHQDATALGTFTGAIETTLVPEPPDNIHTAGGRLLPLAGLPQHLAGDYTYVVIEGLANRSDYVAHAVRAGFDVVWTNDRSVLLHR